MQARVARSLSSAGEPCCRDTSSTVSTTQFERNDPSVVQSSSSSALPYAPVPPIPYAPSQPPMVSPARPLPSSFSIEAVSASSLPLLSDQSLLPLARGSLKTSSTISTARKVPLTDELLYLRSNVKKLSTIVRTLTEQNEVLNHQLKNLRKAELSSSSSSSFSSSQLPPGASPISPSQSGAAAPNHFLPSLPTTTRSTAHLSTQTSFTRLPFSDQQTQTSSSSPDCLRQVECSHVVALSRVAQPPLSIIATSVPSKSFFRGSDDEDEHSSKSSHSNPTNETSLEPHQQPGGVRPNGYTMSLFDASMSESSTSSALEELAAAVKCVSEHVNSSFTNSLEKHKECLSLYEPVLARMEAMFSSNGVVGSSSVVVDYDVNNSTTTTRPVEMIKMEAGKSTNCSSVFFFPPSTETTISSSFSSSSANYTSPSVVGVGTGMGTGTDLNSSNSSSSGVEQLLGLQTCWGFNRSPIASEEEFFNEGDDKHALLNATTVSLACQEEDRRREWD